jgi:NAD(P)-dependent dehydrogenase (short-subunit alcohol dehydrogenase family)
MMTLEVTEKTVLITGTSTGIGWATALHLDQVGFPVIATVRKTVDAEKLQAAASPRLKPLLLDVTDPDSLGRAAEALSSLVSNQGLWGLVNNAGIGFGGPLEFFPLDRMRRLFEVNLFGVLAVTQMCLPYLRRAQGRILNVSSTASLMAAPFHGPYSCSKFALNALSNALRLELKPFGVQVSTLVCGSIKTPIWSKGGQESSEIWEEMPDVAKTLYGSRYLILSDFFGKIGQSGILPEEAARIVAQALTASRPKQSYYIGRDAQLYRLTKFIGERQRDALILRTIGLDQ